MSLTCFQLYNILKFRAGLALDSAHISIYFLYYSSVLQCCIHRYTVISVSVRILMALVANLPVITMVLAISRFNLFFNCLHVTTVLLLEVYFLLGYD